MLNYPFIIRNVLQLFCGTIMMLFLTSNIFAQVPGQVPLNPQKIPQFVDPLPHFAGLRVDAKTATDVYVKAVPHTQQAVSTGTNLAAGIAGVTPGVGLANLWVYRISTNDITFTAPLWPAFTIETERFNKLNVHYTSELGGETYSKVGLVVDPTLHWASPNIPMGTPYDLDPPITVHLHGGEVAPTSDGGPDSWFTAGGSTGHSYNPNAYIYPNTQEAATLWFHDHALGVTRLNVYAGMAGFYFLRDGATEDALNLPGWSGDGLVQEVVPAGASGVFNATPYLPEIEVVIQDRMFDTNGGLYFPNMPTNPAIHPIWTPEFIGDVITVNGKTWPYMSVAPRKYRFRMLNGSNARFYNLSFPKGGPTITQIGTDGGFLDAPVALGNGPLLIAPGERADIIIDFSAFVPVVKKNKTKYSSFVLGNDARTPFPGGGVVQGNTTGRIMEFVVNGAMVGNDASVIPGALKTIPNVKLTNFAGTANPLIPSIAKARQLTLNEVMGPGGPLEALVNNTKWNGTFEGTTRNDFKAVPNDLDPTTDPLDPLLNTYYSETVEEGSTEIWQIINMTGDAHPIHLHLVQFQLMSRQPFDLAGYTAAYDILFPGGGTDPMTGLPYPPNVFMGGYGPPLDYNVDQRLGVDAYPTIGGNPDVTPFLLGAPLPANPNEQGWKDTFIMYPGEVTTVIARWTPTDKAVELDPTVALNEMWFPFDPSEGHGYVWHCHIIDHEDNEMMRPYDVIPNPAQGGGPRLVGTIGANALTDVENENNLPNSFELSQNYPNPFNPSTVINFSIPKENTLVTLKIYNSIGEEVGTLINQVVPAGYHEVNFDASNLTSGVYFYKLNAGDFVESKKMILMK